MRPVPLSEVAGLEDAAVTVGYVSARAPLSGGEVPALRGANGVDGITLRYLFKKSRALKKKEEEEQERRKEEGTGTFRRLSRAGSRAARLRRGEGKRGRRNFLEVVWVSLLGNARLGPSRKLWRRLPSSRAFLPKFGTTALAESRPTMPFSRALRTWQSPVRCLPRPW